MPAFEPFDVVAVPFPFTDRASSKRRPALVLSGAAVFNSRIGNLVLAMITSAQHSGWPLDVQIEDMDAAGLRGPSLVRMKLFTLDTRLVLHRVGMLGAADRVRVARSLRDLFGHALGQLPQPPAEAS